MMSTKDNTLKPIQSRQISYKFRNDISHKTANNLQFAHCFNDLSVNFYFCQKQVIRIECIEVIRIHILSNFHFDKNKTSAQSRLHSSNQLIKRDFHVTTIHKFNNLFEYLLFPCYTNMDASISLSVLIDYKH